MIVREFLVWLCADRRAATSVEYSVILAMIFLAILMSVRGVAGETIDMWNTVASKSKEAVDNSGVK